MFRLRRSIETAPPTASPAPEEAEEKEKPLQRFRITLHVLGAGRDYSEKTRRELLQAMVDTVGADDYRLTPDGAEIVFYDREFESRKKALFFGKRQGAELEHRFKLNVMLDTRKENQGVGLVWENVGAE